MPTNQEQGNSGNNPREPIENTTDGEFKTTPSNAAKNEVRNPSRTTTQRRKQKNTLVEIVSIPSADNTEQIKANNIALWSIVINFSLSILTIILALIAFYQYKSSQSAAEITQRTFEETKKHDSLSMAETKQEFEFENRAYLEVTNFWNLRITPNIISFNYQYTNISIQPAKITREYLVMMIEDTEKPFSLNEFKKQFDNATQDNHPVYVSKEFRKQVTYLSNTNSPQSTIQRIKSGKYSICLYGRTFYTNVMSKKDFIYEFAVRVKGTRDGGFDYMYNENRPIY